eukprot:2542395-Rhodomonas_salina.2
MNRFLGEGCQVGKRPPASVAAFAKRVENGERGIEVVLNMLAKKLLGHIVLTSPRISDRRDLNTQHREETAARDHRQCWTQFCPHKDLSSSVQVGLGARQQAEMPAATMQLSRLTPMLQIAAQPSGLD